MSSKSSENPQQFSLRDLLLVYHQKDQYLIALFGSAIFAFAQNSKSHIYQLDQSMMFAISFACSSVIFMRSFPNKFPKMLCHLSVVFWLSNSVPCKTISTLINFNPAKLHLRPFFEKISKKVEIAKMPSFASNPLV